LLKVVYPPRIFQNTELYGPTLTGASFASTSNVTRRFALWNEVLLVRFQVLTAASMKFTIVFWDVLPCKIIVDGRFRGTCCLHNQGWQYIPEF
jgi:hypothetical protein